MLTKITKLQIQSQKGKDNKEKEKRRRKREGEEGKGKDKKEKGKRRRKREGEEGKGKEKKEKGKRRRKREIEEGKRSRRKKEKPRGMGSSGPEVVRFFFFIYISIHQKYVFAQHPPSQGVVGVRGQPSTFYAAHQKVLSCPLTPTPLALQSQRKTNTEPKGEGQ